MEAGSHHQKKWTLKRKSLNNVPDATTTTTTPTTPIWRPRIHLKYDDYPSFCVWHYRMYGEFYSNNNNDDNNKTIEQVSSKYIHAFAALLYSSLVALGKFVIDWFFWFSHSFFVLRSLGQWDSWAMLGCGLINLSEEQHGKFLFSGILIDEKRQRRRWMSRTNKSNNNQTVQSDQIRIY